MDFTYNEEQEAVRGLADRLFAELATHERARQIEVAGDERGPFDERLWAELASAGLLGIGLGEDVGGAGLDFVSVALVLEAAGRTAAYVPVLETLVAGAGAIESFGSEAQRQRWLPPVIAGDLVVTAALVELVGEVVVPGGVEPTTTAESLAGGGWRLEGTKACVPAGLRADLFVIPATRIGPGGPEGVGVFLVEATAAGLTKVPQSTTTGRPEALVELSGVEVGADSLLGGPTAQGPEIVAEVTERVVAGLCVLEAGACAAALALTSEYAKNREQFGKPIATFQAVGQRAADAYVDAEAIHLTAWQAAWRLSEGLPATAEVAVAKFWAADGGQRVVHAATHLHGGVGVDREYPLHRYFLLTRQIELTLGGAHDSLARLGRILAAEPA